MKEYITKNRARQFVCGHCNEVYSEEPCEPSDCDWMAFIDKEPAADVVPVVRCKDCRLRGREECAMFYCCECGEQHTWETDNDFCSWGERRDRDNA